MRRVLKQRFGQRYRELFEPVEVFAESAHAEEHRVARLPDGSHLAAD